MSYLFEDYWIDECFRDDYVLVTKSLNNGDDLPMSSISSTIGSSNEIAPFQTFREREFQTFLSERKFQC